MLEMMTAHYSVQFCASLRYIQPWPPSRPPIDEDSKKQSGLNRA